jgi:hypothetical protein
MTSSAKISLVEIERRRKIGLAKLKHGHARGSGSVIYHKWAGMLQRCLNQKAVMYPLYGGRGIRVCKRWMAFENFLADMGKPPSPQHTLDRINNNGDYAPENCRWATMKEQTRNRRKTPMVTWRGKTQSVTAWEEELGFPRYFLGSRLHFGWTMDEAVSIPKGHRRQWYAKD